MFYGFNITSDDLNISTAMERLNAPLEFTGACLKPDGTPYGVIVANGKLYNVSERMYKLIKYVNGDVEIVQNTTAPLFDIDFIVSGALVIQNGVKIPDVSSYASHQLLSDTDGVKRVVVSVRNNKSMFVVVSDRNLPDLQDMLLLHGAHASMLVGLDDVYLCNPIHGVKIGERPIVTMYAENYTELIHRPVVVIDAGHGGADCGNSALGLAEKDIALARAQTIQEYLSRTQSGTFLLSRDSDITMSEDERIKFINDVQADFVLSCHSNVANTPTVGTRTDGYESYTALSASETTQHIQTCIHKEVMKKLIRYDVLDNGTYRKPLKLLNSVECPVIQSELLFIDNAFNNALLKDASIVKHCALAEAHGLVNGLGLFPKVVGEEEAEVPTYHVCLGAYPFKSGAEDLKERLRKLGFDGAYVRRF